ncbi:SdpI family protein [Paenarthrobacter aurescens]|nr:SdpI family protein [Paenarthrobacter aurescens]
MGAASSTTMFSIAFLVVAGLLKMLASQIEAGQSRPNPTFGIRSKATMASEEAWIASHEASLRILKGTAVFLLVCTAALWVLFAVLPKDDASVPLIFFSGLGFTAVLVVLLMRMYVKADAVATKIGSAAN